MTDRQMESIEPGLLLMGRMVASQDQKIAAATPEYEKILSRIRRWADVRHLHGDKELKGCPAKQLAEFRHIRI
ncbi:MAG: hypothetical protein ABF632_08495 [Gluconobacter japonicus]|uniref:hypothetical protein n=1 Tax=Gluconobacter japonicus TaxID=376620 RepID=UPI0039E7F6EC